MLISTLKDARIYEKAILRLSINIPYYYLRKKMINPSRFLTTNYIHLTHAYTIWLNALICFITSLSSNTYLNCLLSYMCREEWLQTMVNPSSSSTIDISKADCLERVSISFFCSSLRAPYNPSWSNDIFPLITPNGVRSLCEIRVKVSCFRNSSLREAVTSRKIKTIH